MTKSVLGIASAIAMTLAMTGDAIAGQWSTSGVSITQIEVNDVYGRGTQASFYLTFSGAPSGISGSCSGGVGGQWLVAIGGYPISPTDVTAASIKDIVQQATAAKLAGRPVKVFWNGNCSGGGTSGAYVLTGLQIL